MAKRRRLGGILLPTLILALSLEAGDAFSQLTPLAPASFPPNASGLVGGAPLASSGFVPTAVYSPNAFLGGNDPLAGVNFQACELQANMEAMAAAANSAATSSAGALGNISAALGGISTGIGGGAFSGVGCSGPLTGMSKGTDCASYKMGDKFSLLLLKGAVSDLERTASTASCKIANARKASKVAECFSTEMQKMRESLDYVRRDFQANVDAMEQYVTTVKGEVQKETQKGNTLTKKLEDFKNTISEVQSVIDQVNGSSTGKDDTKTITGLRRRLNEFKDNEKNFELTKSREQARRVAACVAGPGASDSELRDCPAGNGDLQTPIDCLVRIYKNEDELRLSNGSLRGTGDANVRKQSRFDENRFKARLNAMLSVLSGEVPQVNSIDVFLSRFSAELLKYGNAGKFFIDEVRACSSEKALEITNELNDPKAPNGLNPSKPGLGTRAAELRDASDQISSDMGATIILLDKTIRKTGRQVYGQELNELVNGMGCNTAAVQSNPSANGAPGQLSFKPVALQTQLNCADGLNQNLASLLNGTPPPGGTAPILVPLNILGSDGTQVFCKGLLDCEKQAEDLKTLSDQRKEALQGDATFSDSRCPQGCPGLKKFARDSNTAIRTAYQQAADMYARRVAILKLELDRAKSYFSGADISFSSTKPNTVELDSVCPTSDSQICKIPANFGEVLGNMAGVPNIGPEQFDKMAADAKSKQDDAANIAKDVNSQLERLRPLASVCEKKEKDDAMAKDTTLKGSDLDSALADCANPSGSSTDGDTGSSFSDIDDIKGNISDICKASTDTACLSLMRRARNAANKCAALAADARRKALMDAALIRNVSAMGVGGAAPARVVPGPAPAAVAPAADPSSP